MADRSDSQKRQEEWPETAAAAAAATATTAAAATATPVAPVISGLDLGLSRAARPVVAGVNVALHPGEWVALVGPNGAGKSSLLGLLAGVHRPSAGGVRLVDRPLHQWPAGERARRIAWMGQQGEAEGEIAARDVVRLGRLPHHGLLGAPGAQDEAAVEAAMADTECLALADRPLSALSGGERQRVLLARALAVRAPVWLLDEPTAHLDLPHQRALLRSVKAHAAAGGSAVLVLHDLTLALAAHRVWLMQEGRLVADAAPHAGALHAALGRAFGGALVIERAGDGAWVARLRP